MPTLDWIGKSAVVNHHRELPYRLLHCDPALGAGDPAAGNLLVEGDNLHALKALLPYYAGRVKCIYIDPPYNTGDEGWVYNDNVNAPEIQKWLGDTVGKEAEDLSRHDKWLCMMYPRLALLREFLTEDGSIWISLDDNEVANLRELLDEVFGRKNFVATFIWEKRTTRENRRVFSFNHDFIVCYARLKERFEKVRNKLPYTATAKARFKNPDNDPRGPWQSVSFNAQEGHATEAQFYTIVTPGGRVCVPPDGRCWSVSIERFCELLAQDLVWFGKKGNNVPRLKDFPEPDSGEGLVPQTIWTAKECGTTDSATKSLNQIFDGNSGFNTTPKSPELIARILRIATNPGDLILDSFAGSGTTGQAVLVLNAETRQEPVGGKKWEDADLMRNIVDSVPTPKLPDRRFILCELEPKIARGITAKRLSRVVEGYGETPRLGGGFRFCTLGEPILDADARIHPDVKWGDLGHHLWFAETGEPWSAEHAGPQGVESLSTGGPMLGIAPDGRGIYLLHSAQLSGTNGQTVNGLTSETLAQLAPHSGPRLVYAEACTVRPSALSREGIVFKQIPYQVRQQ